MYSAMTCCAKEIYEYCKNKISYMKWKIQTLYLSVKGVYMLSNGSIQDLLVRGGWLDGWNAK